MKPLYESDAFGYYTDVTKLTETVPWVAVKALRKECFMSDVPRKYSYDGPQGHVYDSVPFTDDVFDIMRVINQVHDSNLNVCFLNYYENEKNGLGFHADNSHPIDHNEPIAVVSYGAERDIWWKPQDFKGEIPNEWKQNLGNGSLFIMPPGMQSTHYHKIPKHDRPCGPRISLTFRRYDD